MYEVLTTGGDVFLLESQGVSPSHSTGEMSEPTLDDLQAELDSCQWEAGAL